RTPSSQTRTHSTRIGTEIDRGRGTNFGCHKSPTGTGVLPPSVPRVAPSPLSLGPSPQGELPGKPVGLRDRRSATTRRVSDQLSDGPVRLTLSDSSGRECRLFHLGLSRDSARVSLLFAPTQLGCDGEQTGVDPGR